MTKKHDWNRPVITKNVMKLIKSFEDIGNWLHCIPIIVDSEGFIADGQHRNEAAKILGLPISVIQIDKEDVAKITIALNTNQRNWGLIDFARYWATQTNDTKVAEVYRRFLDYYASNNVTPGVLIAIFNERSNRSHYRTDGGHDVNINEDFKNGDLSFSRSSRIHIESALANLRKLKSASLYSPISRKTFRKQQFQESMLKAMEIECFNFDVFLSKLCRSRHSFNKLAKKVDVYKEIIRIYTKKGK
jgi:hypothetical protein